ncbi:hypothetical protein EMPS_05369 [Entomortierella parvispora]|uniref:SUZ domain-containing protein n=1 Tax=Entomortierella parvispora TaxID=205924 RepID=A0A9P3HA68_9FUNG|nr:hypothetical protein EMPS_05369 [Entomortierella parvispora]
MSQSTAEPKATSVENTSAASGNVTPDSSAQNTAGMFTLLRPTPASQPKPESPKNDSLDSPEPSSSLAKAMEGLDVDDDACDPDNPALDEFLVNALKNRQDRIFLLKLDREFCSFINNPSQNQLEFPSLNSYYRMVIHRVANYFKITRLVDPQQKKIILFKTENSAIPALRFSDLVEEEEEQPVKPMKLLKRNPNRPAGGQNGADGTPEPDRKTISIKEREEAYAKARARIFQEEAPAKPKSNDGSGSNSRSDSPSVAPSTSADTPTPTPDSTDDAGRSSKGRKQPNARRGPSGSAKSPEEQTEDDQRSQYGSLPSSRNVSRSTSPSPTAGSAGGMDLSGQGNGKGVRPKSKHSKADLTADYTDGQRRKSTTSNASSSSGTVRTPVGLARTTSSSSSQDGFQSPGLGGALTESPTINSPSNLQKSYDYFGQNPSMTSGSVSPMSSGSSRTSMQQNQGSMSSKSTRPQGSSSSGGNSSGGASGHHTPNAGFVKGMNTTAFVPKKPYPKHANSNFNNPGPYNNGFTPAATTVMPGQGNFYGNNGNMNNINNNGGINSSMGGNGISAPYTQSTMPSNWQDRNPGQGQDHFPYFQPNQDPSLSGQGFGYSNPGPQFHQPMPFGNPSHTSQNHHQYPHHPVQRGGRRNHSTQPHFTHQSHFQHPSHSRTHPQTQHQSSHYHNNNNNNNNYGGQPSRDDYAFSQGMRSAPRFGRGNDMNSSLGPYGNDFNNLSHGNNVDMQAAGHIYNGYVPQTSGPISNDNIGYGPRHPQNQKGLYDPNWGPNQEQSAPFNPPFQGPSGGGGGGGKKQTNKFNANNPMGQPQHPSSIITAQGGPSSSQASQGSAGFGNNQGGHGMYSVERRPPKSAELFDPNGGQGFGQGSASGPGDYGFGRQGAGDGGFVPGQDSVVHTNDRSYPYQGQHHNNFSQHHSQSGSQSMPQQQQQPPQNTLSQFPPLQAHVPVAMNRSYSSSSSTGHGAGSTSSPGPHQGKKNNLIYDYSVLVAPYDGVSKGSSESEKPAPTLSHILEIFDFDPADNIFSDLVLPQGSKLRRLKPSAKDPAGQCLAIFKNGVLANEALSAFQEGKESWMGAEALKSRPEAVTDESKAEDGEGDETAVDMRIQKRFNVKVWTPVLVNTATAASSTSGRAASCSASDSQVTTSTSTPLTPSAPELTEAGASEMGLSEQDSVDSSSTVSEAKTQL